MDADILEAIPKLFETEYAEKFSSDFSLGIVKLYVFEWNVGDFRLLKCLAADSIKSTDFKIVHETCVIRLQLIPGTKVDCFKIMVSLIRADGTDCTGVCKRNPALKDAEVKLEFLDLNGKILDYFVLTPNFFYSHGSKCFMCYQEENLLRFVENNSLNLRFKVALKLVSDPKGNDPVWTKNIETLSVDLRKVLERSLHPDLAIKVDGQRFLVHKCILLHQFDFVSKLLFELKEIPPVGKLIPNNSVDSTEAIESISFPKENAQVFKSVLEFIYSGKLQIGNSIGFFDLYSFALKYQLHELIRLLKPEEMHIQTQVQKVNKHFYWHIKDYSIRCLEKFAFINSPVFQMESDGTSWHIVLFFFDSKSIFLSLKQVCGHDVDVQTSFSLIVCNPDGTYHEKREFQINFRITHRTQPENDSGCKTAQTSYPGFLNPESRFTISPDLLFDDTLVVCCEISACDKILTCMTRHIQPSFRFKKMWQKNLQNLHDTGDFSDVILKVDDTDFSVHKAILSARSPVFARMFETNMAEKIKNCVKIEDIDCGTMKCALRYIYTGSLDVLTISAAIELYRTADKYEMLTLKKICAQFIIHNVDSNHACEVFMLADLYNEMEMKVIAKDRICRNASVALLTDYGQELMLNHPQLAHDIFDTLSAVYCSLPP